MSVVVQGMEMPRGCFFCLLVGDDCRCRVSHLDVQHLFRRHDACPLIEIPNGRVNVIISPESEVKPNE